MGASGWDSFVPYQPDINKALQELRAKVFQDHGYYLRAPLNLRPEDFANASKDIQEMVPQWIEREKSYKPPTTIEELIAWNGEDGTHSILDIHTVASSSGFGVAAPLSREELRRFFGTDQPTHTMIGEKKRELSRFLQGDLGRYGYEATYIIVYKDGAPDEIFFTGYSGD